MMRMRKVCMRPADKPGICRYAIYDLCTYKPHCKYLHVEYIRSARQSGKSIIRGLIAGGSDDE